MPVETETSKRWRASFLTFARDMRDIARPHGILSQSPIMTPPTGWSELVGAPFYITARADNDNKKGATCRK